MLSTLQRLIGRTGTGSSDLSWVDGWARRRHESCKRVRGVEGFVIEGKLQGRPSRLECGPSQRHYLVGNELRMRAEIGLPPGLEMLVVTRGVAEYLEVEAYETLTQAQQTAADTSLPEEGRWLSMYERVPPDGMPPGLAHSFVAVAAYGVHAGQWLEGELGQRLQRARDKWLGDSPLLVMTLRGRLYLRTAADHLDETYLDGVRGVAEAASTRALQMVADGLATRRSSRYDEGI